MAHVTKSLRQSNNHWAQYLGHGYYYYIICHWWGSIWTWRWYRHCWLPDHYSDTMNDLVGTYCAGGEL